MPLILRGFTEICQLNGYATQIEFVPAILSSSLTSPYLLHFQFPTKKQEFINPNQPKSRPNLFSPFSIIMPKLSPNLLYPNQAMIIFPLFPLSSSNQILTHHSENKLQISPSFQCHLKSDLNSTIPKSIPSIYVMGQGQG